MLYCGHADGGAAPGDTRPARARRQGRRRRTELVAATCRWTRSAATSRSSPTPGSCAVSTGERSRRRSARGPYAVRREQAPAAKAAIAIATAGLLRDGPGDPAGRGHDDARGRATPSPEPAGDGDHEQPADRGRPRRASERRGHDAGRRARQGRAGAGRRCNRRSAPFHPGRRAHTRRLQPASRVRDHGARPGGVVRQARDDRERRRGGRRRVRGEARLRRAVRRRVGRAS